jgi:hypothetical protein
VTAVPDYVPMLIKGKGATPEDGGCLVQIANWLADPTTWTDEAKCVDPSLARLAIYANDIADDEHRRRLALLAPRLAGTKIEGEVAELAVENQLKGYVWGHRPPEPKFHHGIKWSIPTKDQQTVLGKLNLDNLVILDQDGLCDWLEGVIDEYDRITGRNAPELLTQQEWEQIKELVGQ